MSDTPIVTTRAGRDRKDEADHTSRNRTHGSGHRFGIGSLVHRPPLVKKISNIVAMRAWSKRQKSNGQVIGFVPTMGALHEGHLSLVRAALKRCDAVVVSIFVNPTQFGPGEDYKRYPRTLTRDLQLLRTIGVDAVFTPRTQDMYPSGFETTVHVGKLAEKLCGPFRPGHFDGVATVVTKLFEIVRPDFAFFGHKDYQQQLIIKQVVRDLDLPVRIVDLPTVREPDGLAMSSRNRYLSASDRVHARKLYNALIGARQMVARGEKNASTIRNGIRKILRKIPGGMIDYVSLCDPATLEERKKVGGAILAALAVRIGRTRLIDNLLIKR